MTLNHRDLVVACVEALDTFDPEICALEEHISNFLHYSKIYDESDATFVTEVFSGCVRYAAVLRVVMDGFFVRDGKTVLRSGEHLYRVFCYLALFRLDELGIGHFRKFVRAQDVNKMYKFLSFFADDKNLKTWIKDEWLKQYENSFVQTTLLSPLLRWLPELQELIHQLKEKINNKVKLKKTTAAAAPTELKPFNLTQPRPRSIPVPEQIPKLQPHKQVPVTTYVEPKEKTFLQKNREVNRRKAEENLMHAARKQFDCANPDKSEKTRARMKTILLDEESKLDFNKHKCNPLPVSLLEDNIPIKLNAAAILREGKLYQQREQEELKKLERLQAGARDPGAFLEWQTKMRQADLDRQLADIERRRLEGKLSHEEAILARKGLIQENRQKVQQMKQEAQDLMNDYLERRLEEEHQMRSLVEDVMEGHENAKDAKKKLQEYKARVVQEVNEESQELMRRALEEAEEEMRKKMELIQQIRAMEATPVIRNKLVDKTSTAGHGLLSEMSIAELNERLALYKITEKDEEETKRDDILCTKQAKDQKLLETLETISRHRKEHTKVAASRLEDRKNTHQTRPIIKDEKLLALQQKLEEKKDQRKREQEASRIVPDKKSSLRIQTLAQEKKSSEQSRWQELEQTRERTAKLVSKGIESSQSASRLAANRQLLTMY